MVYRHLPPLNSVRAFEAAARHLSIKQAAAELGVTPGAVSRQITNLEGHLGYDLFTRVHGGLSLRAPGRALLKTFGEALDKIASGVAEAARPPVRIPIRLGVLSIFASRWFIPRWRGLLCEEVEFEIELTTSNEALQLLPSRFDAIITVGDGLPLPGFSVVPLLPIGILPVCAPQLVSGGQLDLRQHRLLHSRQRPQDWRRWLQAAGIKGVDPDSGIFLESITLAIDAAAEGLGVALAMETLIDSDIQNGRVVVPMQFCRPTRRHFQMVCNETRAGEPSIKALAEWLRCEATLSGGSINPILQEGLAAVS